MRISEQKNNKVSVVIPVYNVEAFIGECLYSVRNQTLKEIEIICVNDGTQDQSMKIVENHAAADKRIVILHKKNGGLSTARNAGLMQATGEYVYFLDSDDAILPETLEILYEKSKSRQLDNIYFGAYTVYENKHVKKKFYRRFENYYHRIHEYPDVLKGSELLKLMEQYGEYRMSACLQMPRRQFIIDNQLYFYEGILHEDNLFSLQCILRAERAAVVNRDFYMRRVREGSIMTARDTMQMQSSWGYYVCLRQMMRFIKDIQYDSETMETIGKILTVMQRDAAYDRRGLTKEKADKRLPCTVTAEDRMWYCLLVQNVAESDRRSDLRTWIINKLKFFDGK